MGTFDSKVRLCAGAARAAGFVILMVVLLVGTGCRAMLTRTTDLKQPVKFDAGQRVAVSYFSLEGAQLPQKTDDFYKSWELNLSKSLAEAVCTQLNDAGFQAESLPPGQATNADFVIRGRYVTVDPGKKAARGWAMAFGGHAGDAGKANLVLEGEILNRQGEAIMTFYHKEVPPQSFLTDSGGAFTNAMDVIAKRFANEFKERTRD
jgi:hypothetical protein